MKETLEMGLKKKSKLYKENAPISVKLRFVDMLRKSTQSGREQRSQNYEQTDRAIRSQ